MNVFQHINSSQSDQRKSKNGKVFVWKFEFLGSVDLRICWLNAKIFMWQKGGEGEAEPKSWLKRNSKGIHKTNEIKPQID